MRVVYIWTKGLDGKLGLTFEQPASLLFLPATESLQSEWGRSVEMVWWQSDPPNTVTPSTRNWELQALNILLATLF